MKKICPFCDSEKVEEIEIADSYPVPFCENATISRRIFRCSTCEAEGDFTHSNDKVLAQKIAEANFSSVPSLIEDLAKHGVTMTYFEKALRIPFRTTARWKRGKISHSALALLRLIRFSPALLEVADDNFSETAQAKYQVTQPYYFFEKHTTNGTCLLTLGNGAIEIDYQGEFPNLHLETNSPSEQTLKWEMA